MKTLLLRLAIRAVLGSAAALHAEPVPAPVEMHAESAEAKSHAEPAESAEAESHAESAENAEAKPHAESAEAESHAESAESAEAKSHAEPAESAEAAASGVAGSPSDPEAEPGREGRAGQGGRATQGQTGLPSPASPSSQTSQVPPVSPVPQVRDSPPHSERGVARSAGGSTPCGSKHRAKSHPSLRAEVRLADGSVLKGTLRQRFIPARSPNLGKIRVDLSKVVSVEFHAGQEGREGQEGRAAPGQANIPFPVSPSSQTPQVPLVSPVPQVHNFSRSSAVVSFRNGDVITATLAPKHDCFVLDTLVGTIAIPLRAVSSLAVASEATHSSLVTRRSSLLYHCTFDDAQSVERPAAGPAGKFLAGSFVPGKNGRALRVEADTPAFESKLPKGFLGPEGCLEFWAKIEGDDPRYVDGGDPLFVSFYNERGAITLLQFAANNGFARGGLGGAFASWPFGTIPHYSWSMEYRKVLGENWADWHHYAMSWKAGGFGDGSFVKVFVDGKPQPVLGGVDDDKVPARLADYVNHAHDLGIPWSTARAADRRSNRKPFLVDDLRIWSVAKTDFACDRPIHHSSFLIPHSELLYHCTFDNAQSIECPAVGPNGKLLGGDFVPGKKGNALRIPGNIPTALVDLPRGLLQPKGTIEFWSKIEDPPASYGDRGNPRFFGLALFDDPANPGPYSTYLQFTSNDGMGMSGLCGMIYHRAMATDPHMRTHTYGPILEDPAAWHHYAIVWDSDGLSFSKASDGTPAVAAIVLDGRVLQTFGRNQSAHGKGLLRLPELQGRLAFPVEDTGWGFFPRPVAFLIDEFKIWSAPRTEFVLQ